MRCMHLDNSPKGVEIAGVTCYLCDLYANL